MTFRQLVFDEYRWIIIVCCVIAVLAGAWITYGTYVDPAQTTTEQPVGSWATTGNVSHGATVVEDTAVHEAGTELENEPVYYEQVSPTLEGTVTTGYEASTAEDVTGNVSTSLIWQAVDEDDETGEETVYWRERERLDQEAVTGLEPGEAVEATFTVNVSSVHERIDVIEDELGASPGDRDVFVLVEYEVEGTINGIHRSESNSERLPIERDGGTYSIETPSSMGEEFQDTEPMTETVSYGPERTVGGPILVLLGLGMLGAMIAIPRDRYRLSEGQRAWQTYQSHRKEYGELVTTTALPEIVHTRDLAPVDSLEGLVQLGIDLEAPILRDRSDGRYLVLTDDLVYWFEPPAPPESSSSVASDESTAKSNDDEVLETGVDESISGEDDESGVTSGSSERTVTEDENADGRSSADSTLEADQSDRENEEGTISYNDEESSKRTEAESEDTVSNDVEGSLDGNEPDDPTDLRL